MFFCILIERGRKGEGGGGGVGGGWGEGAVYACSRFGFEGACKQFKALSRLLGKFFGLRIWALGLGLLRLSSGELPQSLVEDVTI